MFFPPTSKRLSVAVTDDVSSSFGSSYTEGRNSRGKQVGGGNNDPGNNNIDGPVVSYAKEIIVDRTLTKQNSGRSSISSISMETKGPRDFETTHS